MKNTKLHTYHKLFLAEYRPLQIRRSVDRYHESRETNNTGEARLYYIIKYSVIQCVFLMKARGDVRHTRRRLPKVGAF